MENLIEQFCFHRYEGKTMVDKINPRRVKAESQGDTIVSLLYAAAAGDLSALKTHKVRFISQHVYYNLFPVSGSRYECK